MTLSPTGLGLPSKFTKFRPGQLEVAQRVARSDKFCFELDSPTGTGKSLLAITASELIDMKTVYLVSTKALQHQIHDDFNDVVILEGRENYPCMRRPSAFPYLNAAMCTHNDDSRCPVIENCAYLKQKVRAIMARQAVFNYALFLTETNFVGKLGGVPFVIADEADCLENELMSFISLTITRNQLEKYGLEEPKYKTKLEAWKDACSKWIDVLSRAVGDCRIDINKLSPRELRDLTRAEQLLSKVRFFHSNVDESWVSYIGTDKWEFKPTWVSRYAKARFWDHMTRALAMSATILNPQQYSREVGLDYNEVDYECLPCPFPVENRRIVYRPVAKVSHRTKSECYPKLVLAFEEILEQHKDVKVLVHTVSYELCQYLMDNCKNPRLMTHTTANRSGVLETFKTIDAPAVLLSPSMERGVSLDYDMARVVVVLKVPFANLGDPQVKKRVYGSKDGPKWYAYDAIRSLIQATGRATRAMDDYSISYIFDEQLEPLAHQYRHYFPQWWVDAVEAA